MRGVINDVVGSRSWGPLIETAPGIFAVAQIGSLVGHTFRLSYLGIRENIKCVRHASLTLRDAWASLQAQICFGDWNY